MALIFMEGFDHREPAGRNVTTTTNTIAYVAGRVGGYAVAPNTPYSITNLSVPIAPGSSGGFWVSVAFKRFIANTNVDMRLLSAGNVAATSLGAVVLKGNNTLTVNGPDGVLATSTATISPTGWHRVDMFFKQDHAPNGRVEAWLDGNLVAVGNGKTHLGYNNDPAAQVMVELGHAMGGLAIDDFYVTDLTGPAPYNTRLPDLRIETLVPSSSGSASQLMGSDGNQVDNNQLVDEMPTNTADYVTSGTPGERDLYSFTNLAATSGQVWGVQLHANALKTDAGVGALHPLTRMAAGSEGKQAAVGLSTSPGWISGAIQTEAPGAVPWTVATVNSAEFGVEIA